MPSRFERYRMADGVTPLAARYFNPVWQELDLRLTTLEALQLSWEAAVRAVSDFGLVRINEVLGPALTGATETVADIEQKHAAALAALDALQAAILTVEARAQTDIEAWKAARLAELTAWRAALDAGLPDIKTRLVAVEGALPGLSEQLGGLPDIKTRLDAVEGALPGLSEQLVGLDADLSGLASRVDKKAEASDSPLIALPTASGAFDLAAGSSGQLALVDGYGLYRFDPDSTEIADGETVLEPAGGVGRWSQVSPSWDFVWAYLSGLLDDIQYQMDTVNLANPTALANLAAAQAAITALQSGKVDASKVLTGSASLDFASIAAGASATLTIAVPGAATTDRVVLTPPATIPNGVVPLAYIGAADTVTVRLNNVTTAAIDPAAMTYLVTVLKP